MPCVFLDVFFHGNLRIPPLHAIPSQRKIEAFLWGNNHLNDGEEHPYFLPGNMAHRRGAERVFWRCPVVLSSMKMAWRCKPALAHRWRRAMRKFMGRCRVVKKSTWKVSKRNNKWNKSGSCLKKFDWLASFWELTNIFPKRLSPFGLKWAVGFYGVDQKLLPIVNEDQKQFSTIRRVVLLGPILSQAVLHGMSWNVIYTWTLLNHRRVPLQLFLLWWF